jgi:DNA-binding NtrC family response regulator
MAGPNKYAGNIEGHMGIHADRSLLYISRRHDMALCEFLAGERWRIIFASTSRDVERLTLPGGPLAGLFDVHSGYSDRDLDRLEPFLTLPTVGWVASTPPGETLAEKRRQLLGLYFLDYFTLPREPAFIAQSLGHAVGMAALRQTGSPASSQVTMLKGMVGSCDAMQGLFRTIGKIAKSDAPVLITGESGTGKELAALAIHRGSARAAQPFVAVNCAAIPPTLLLSELFGYEKGAFTGALQRRTGRVESAHSGTLFLDEIGDMPVECQAALLRFLQEGTIERLGGTGSIPVDVRILSATHVDLNEAIAAGRFRSDLFHRLCVLRVEQPPLRMRGDDIGLLARHLLGQVRKTSGHGIKGFSPAAMRAIASYDWPGNVRELINRIRRAVVMAEGSVITPDDLDLLPSGENPALTLAEVRDSAIRHAIEQALQRHHERLVDVADELGISRATLYRLMRDYNLEMPKDQLHAVDESAA